MFYLFCLLDIEVVSFFISPITKVDNRLAVRL